MTLRRTFQWLVVLVLLAALGLGGYAWHVWEQRDLLLQATLNEKLPELLPGWNVRIGRVHFDWYRRIRIHDVVLRGAEDADPLLTIPEMIVTVDRQALTQSQQVVLQRIRLLAPVIDLTRDPSGRWNFQDVPPIKRTDRALPEWEVEQGSLRVTIQRPEGTPVVFALRRIDLKLVPSGRRAYVAQGATDVNQAGTLVANGRFDLEAKTWGVEGKIQNVTTSGELLALAARTSPALRAKLVQVETKLDALREKLETASTDDEEPPLAFSSGVEGPATRRATNVPLVVGPNEMIDPAPRLRPHPGPDLEAVPDTGSTPGAALGTLGAGGMGLGNASNDPLGGLSPNYVPDFGVTGTLDVGFRLDQSRAGGVPEFHIDVALREGQATHAVLPFPLHELAARFECDNHRMELKSLSARNGKTQLVVGGRVDRIPGAVPGRFTVKVTDLPLDERVRSRLTPGLRKLYDSLQPTGVIDFEGTIASDGEGKWKPHGIVVTAREGTAAHVKFPYRVTDAAGTIVQNGDELEIRFEGRAGRRPVLVQGIVRHPGPEAETILDIYARQLPLDDTLLAACPPQVQAPLRTLNLRGFADGEARLYRPPGRDQKIQLFITGDVSKGTFEYLHFPYRLTNLAGHVEFSSPDETWTFTRLSAEHGDARLTGEGSFSRRSPPGELKLTVHAENAAIDQQLNLALPDSLRRLWDELTPTGTIRSLTTHIAWTPGAPADIELPEIDVDGGSLLVKAFPFAMHDVDAKMAWADGILTLESYAARHEETEIRARGFVETSPQGDWRLQLTSASVDDLYPDRVFRRALPKPLKSIVDQIDPQGAVSLSGMMELRGWGDPRDPVTAAWDVQAVLTGATVNAGVALKNVHGKLTSRGTFDGEVAEFAGRLDLDSLMALDHQFTQIRGPYALRDTQLIVGSAEALLPDPRPGTERKVPAQQRVVARFVGGAVVLDASATFNETPVYDAKLMMVNGRLEEYAARYLSGASNLRGTMNGWVDLHGTGSSTKGMTGRGVLQISPAALYELPVIVQIFRTLSFTPPDKTAFHRAETNFTIAREQFQFSEINLVGDAISLRGHGTAKFDGNLKLDFYSQAPKTGLANIPLINIVAREATKNWVGVEVSGHVSSPNARVKALPQLDDALKRFLGAFNPAQPIAPRMQIPGLPY